MHIIFKKAWLILVSKTERKILFVNSKCKWQNNTILGFKIVGFLDLVWIQLISLGLLQVG